MGPLVDSGLTAQASDELGLEPWAPTPGPVIGVLG